MQRDAPPDQLSPNRSKAPTEPSEDFVNINKQQKITSTTLVGIATEFDMLAEMLPLPEGGAEVQLELAQELQAENEAVGQELERQLEATEQELKQVQELFKQAAENCLNLKTPNSQHES